MPDSEFAAAVAVAEELRNGTESSRSLAVRLVIRLMRIGKTPFTSEMLLRVASAMAENTPREGLQAMLEKVQSLEVEYAGTTGVATNPSEDANTPR